MRHARDLTGQKFNKLTVTGPSYTVGRRQYAPCVCDCGNTKDIRIDHVLRGHTVSCGCKNQDKAKRGHDGFREKCHPLRQLWGAMKARCFDEKHPSYYLYGAKGVTVCERWLTFENFVEDMAPRPAGTSLDREDGNGPYCKENCRWATATEQGRNKSNNRLVTLYGMSKPVTFWAEVSGTPSKTIYARLDRGWNEKKAVFTPPRPLNRDFKAGKVEAV
jgi:hypothetical protein